MTKDQFNKAQALYENIESLQKRVKVLNKNLNWVTEKCRSGNALSICDHNGHGKVSISNDVATTLLEKEILKSVNLIKKLEREIANL